MRLNLNYAVKLLLLILGISLSGCGFKNFTGDTLGGFRDRTFPISKKKLELAIDQIPLLNPEYRVPEKWKYENTSIRKSYFFLESRILYFKNNPEEMYYISFVGDSATFADTTKTTISIRLIYNGGLMWLKQSEIDSNEHKRIEKRFDNEIISKLEKYTNTRAKKEDIN